MLDNNCAAEKFVHPHIFLRLGGQKAPHFSSYRTEIGWQVVAFKPACKALRLSPGAAWRPVFMSDIAVFWVNFRPSHLSPGEMRRESVENS
jgi:hypothetical protein